MMRRRMDARCFSAVPARRLGLRSSQLPLLAILVIAQANIAQFMPPEAVSRQAAPSIAPAKHTSTEYQPFLSSTLPCRGAQILSLRGGEQQAKRKRLNQVSDADNQVPETQQQQDSAREAAKPRLTQSSFTDLEPKLNSKTLSALAELGFNLTAPVQQAVIPLLLTNKDVIVQAPTGSGKTVAFLVPAFELLLRSDEEWPPLSAGSIIILPTRELASQVGALAAFFSKHTKLPSHELVGGSNQTHSEETLKASGGNILIGTPGRLQQTLASNKGLLRVSDLQLLVLDEADRLLALGFRAALASIFGLLPKQRRTGLFSATMDSGVSELARAGLRNPRKVTVSVQTAGGREQATPTELHNYWTQVHVREKLAHLVSFLQGVRARGGAKVMVFMLTCCTVDYLAKLLPRLDECIGLHFLGLNGKQVQTRRMKTYAAFVAAKSAVLLCTDVAARGLDVADVEWVVQYDPPQDPDMFVHRVGRAGRMGKGGKSLVFLCPNELPFLQVLKARKLPMEGLRTVGSPPPLLASIRAVLRGDRDLLNKSERAYVSTVRGYREHRCEAVFKLEELDLAGLAIAFGMMRLPYMRELLQAGAKAVRRQLVLEGFEPDPMDPKLVKFRDPTREKARVEREAREAAEEKEGATGRKVRDSKKNLSWSKKLDRMERREKRRRKKGVKPEVKEVDKEEEEEESEGEQEQLRKEMAMLKKLKSHPPTMLRARPYCATPALVTCYALAPYLATRSLLSYYASASIVLHFDYAMTCIVPRICPSVHATERGCGASRQRKVTQQQFDSAFPLQ